MLSYPALYIRDGDAVSAGRKTALGGPTQRYSPGDYLLIVKQPDSTYLVPGSVTLAPPTELDAAAFDAAFPAHLISRKQRLSWWPLAETFYLYPLTYTPAPAHLAVILAPGSTGTVALKGLDLPLLDTVDGWYIHEVI